MPICKQPPMAVGNNKSAAEIDDHSSEAAKVKRTREQAYFNSYDFDAIEALPYSDAEGEAEAEDDDTDRRDGRDARNQRRKSPAKLNSLNKYKTIERSSLPAKSNSSSSRSSSSTSSGGYAQPNHTVEATRSADNGNFLLPRAMLKYQSTNVANSMPLAAVGPAHIGPTKLLPSGGTSSTTLMMTTATSVRPGYTNGGSCETGFLMAAALDKTATTSTATTLAARSKKRSTSSTITTTDESTACEAPDLPPQPAGVRSAKQTDAKTPTASSSCHTTDSEQRGRSHSHQSHYSTDKSGSSGYYSSNVCSTYSVEDHIYCEPVIDILDLNSKSKSVFGGKVQQPPRAAQPVAASAPQPLPSRVRDMNVGAQAQRLGSACEKYVEGVTGDADPNKNPHFQEHLRILETSIENLDRHLKNFPSLSSQERIVSFVQSHHTFLPTQPLPYEGVVGDKMRIHSHLPTILESFDAATPPTQKSWRQVSPDDSLRDIDLDAFLLANEASKHAKVKRLASSSSTTAGIDNPSFLNDEQEENHYKCAKYINSCPDDAYRVESDIATGTVSEKSTSIARFPKRYEDQLHFQNTRELLEDVRDKIRLLSRSSSVNSQTEPNEPDEAMPKELDGMIKTLKSELECYLNRMNQQSEQEIRQLCSGLIKSQHIVKMRKAFERRGSSFSSYDAETAYAPYECIREGGLVTASGVPPSIRHQISSIRCASDPNFKMKRKSLTEVFPADGLYIEAVNENRKTRSLLQAGSAIAATQLQRNLAFHKPVLDQLNAKVDAGGAGLGSSGSGSGSGAESSGVGDKDSMLEWHRKKPSIWEQYYGSNRMNQSLLGKRNGMVANSNQATMSYPSSRPESDFTLDLPRAEQLRIKMEKDKKFRQRCRYITSFLSLVFFLLTVMVVSLVLTRGKRMFGSMI